MIKTKPALPADHPVFTVEKYSGELAVVERVNGKVVDAYLCGDLSKAEAERLANGMRSEAAAVARNAKARDNG